MRNACAYARVRNEFFLSHTSLRKNSKGRLVRCSPPPRRPSGPAASSDLVLPVCFFVLRTRGRTPRRRLLRERAGLLVYDDSGVRRAANSLPKGTEVAQQMTRCRRCRADVPRRSSERRASTKATGTQCEGCVRNVFFLAEFAFPPSAVGLTLALASTMCVARAGRDDAAPSNVRARPCAIAVAARRARRCLWRSHALARVRVLCAMRL